MNENKINTIAELVKKAMLEDDYINVNEYLYLQKTWNGKTSNSVCITLYDDTNIYLRMTEKIKYISIDSCKYGDWEDYNIETIYEYEDTIIKCLIGYLSQNNLEV
ncbi:hypothetical protein QJL30_09965 [Clostridioides difficile]|nr:hypothetical protein [Clostridioides difficile]MDI3004264.1 hypothetical protein [Clostridioides difficile]